MIKKEIYIMITKKLLSPKASMNPSMMLDKIQRNAPPIKPNNPFKKLLTICY